jgi:TolB protein
MAHALKSKSLSGWLLRVILCLSIITLPLPILAGLIGRTLPRQVITLVSSRENMARLYTLDITRGLSHKLSDQPVIDCCAVWSPDGERIAFLSLDDAVEKIFLIDWNGRNLRRLTREKNTIEVNPVWSPDSAEIAFVYFSLYTGKAAIYIADGDAAPRPLTPGTRLINDFLPVWSPDGNKILFASDVSLDGTSRLEDTELFTVQPDGERRAQITNDASHDSAPAISPDGKRIAFTTTPPDYFPIAIYIMDADGGGRFLVTDQDISRNTAPVWSPDGSHILFLSHRDGDVEIFRVDADGKNLRQLTRNTALDWLPSWSPDGSHILFLSARDGDSAVYSMDADGANPRRLTPYPATDTFALWQPG